MITFELNDTYTLCSTESTPNLISSLLEEIKKRELSEHLILDLSTTKITSKEIESFKEFSELKRENNSSFVVIALNIDIDSIPEEINVVPTIQEAIDVLELDAIERDLMGL